MSTVRCVDVSVTIPPQCYLEGAEMKRRLSGKEACEVLGDMQHNAHFVPPVHLLCTMSDLCVLDS